MRSLTLLSQFLRVFLPTFVLQIMPGANNIDTYLSIEKLKR